MAKVTLAAALLPACMLVASCSKDDAQPEQTEAGPVADPLATRAPLSVQVADFPELESRECLVVAQFYFVAVQEGQFAPAALVWDDPVIDAARLQALFSAYAAPRFAIQDVMQEGAAGSLYCTVTAALSDAANPTVPPVEGTLQLRRVNDVPGATPSQLRWTIIQSTFLETMERSARS